MRLLWKQTGETRFDAEGSGYAYKVDSDGHGRYRVMQMRQPGGQPIREATMPVVEAATARAQVWEDA